ncbi:HNH endonuclease [Listeria booriae]|uniref:HNH endonuclease n=1 Tax=Listeria booriae TaxID=1552123 RepID=UPI0035E3C106
MECPGREGYKISKKDKSAVFEVEIKHVSRNNKEANIQAGLDKNSIPPVPVLSRAPSDYTWHHMEDGKTMMLVDKKVHA